jgi:hypothetical protein
VGKGAGVDQDPGHPVAGGGMNPVDQRPFMVGLEGVDRDPEAGSKRGQSAIDVGQGGVPIDFRLARSEQIQIGAVQDKNAHGGQASAVRRLPASRVSR